MQWLNQLVTWWQSLSAAAAFFFTIPFAVAGAALAWDLMGRRRRTHWHRVEHRVNRP